MEHGLLYFKDKKRGVNLQVTLFFGLRNSRSLRSYQAVSADNLLFLQVITAAQKLQILEGCHSRSLGGRHLGRDKTLTKISERYYWLRMVEDVKEYCRTCDKCQRANRYNSTTFFEYSVACTQTACHMYMWRQ